MTKCVLSAWNLKIHNTTALNALNWNVYEINSKMTLSMATYSRVVSWSRKRSPLCSSTSWRPGSASSRRVYQGLKNTGPEDCTLCIIMGNIYICSTSSSFKERWVISDALKSKWQFRFQFFLLWTTSETLFFLFSLNALAASSRALFRCNYSRFYDCTVRRQIDILQHAQAPTYHIYATYRVQHHHISNLL